MALTHLAADDERLERETNRLAAARTLSVEGRQRIEHELHEVCRHGLSGLVLRAFDLATLLRSHALPFFVESGTWPGSALSWTLGITDVDPLALGLYFERLLNPEHARLAFPPFFAVPADAASVVGDWLATRYGAEHIVETFVGDPPGDLVTCGFAARAQPVGAAARRAGQLTEYAQMERDEALRSSSLDYVPISTPVSLQVLHRTQRSAGVAHIKAPPASRSFFHRLASAAQDGQLALQSPGFQKLVAAIKPEHFEHLVAAEALWRPSAIEQDLAARYIARRHRQADPTPPHTLLEPALTSTYGLLLYQEQIVEAVVRVAGFSLERADLLRRQLARRGHSTPAPFREDFVACARRNGVDGASAGAVFAALADAAPYAASKAGFAQCATRLVILFEASTRFPSEWQEACAEVGLDG